jgi:NADH dehydrogenase/NADH:ubiquinone oxidoreductase subunit G
VSEKTVSIQVDGKPLTAGEGEVLLKVCLDNGIYIPHLCYLEGIDPLPVSCRLCFVEIDGQDRPAPSCRISVKEGLVVQTDTPGVRRLQRTGLKLLLSTHHVDCKNCPANRKCALQDMARFLKVGLKSKTAYLKDPPVRSDHPHLDYYVNRCVLCGRCVEICRTRQQHPELTFIKRGFETVIGFFGHNAAKSPDWATYGACIEACPVGALLMKENATGIGIPDDRG